MTSFPNVKKKDDEHLPSKYQQQSNSTPQVQSPSKDQEHVPQQRKSNKITYVKMESPEEYDQNIRKRIEMVLKIASAGGEPITYHQYEMAVVQQPRKGSEVLLRRDIDEVFMTQVSGNVVILAQDFSEVAQP